MKLPFLTPTRSNKPSPEAPFDRISADLVRLEALLMEFLVFFVYCCLLRGVEYP